METCTYCRGDGLSPKSCPPCSGLGSHTCACGDSDHTCGVCLGSGRSSCLYCNGGGYHRKKRARTKKAKQKLTRMIDSRYLTRHTAEIGRENSYLLGDETSTLPGESLEMIYKVRKFDLTKASVSEKKYRDDLIAVLTRFKWDISKAARHVKLSRSSMYRRIYILSIKIPPQSRGRRGPSIFDHKIAGVKG